MALKEVSGMVSLLTPMSADPTVAEQLVMKLEAITANMESYDSLKDSLLESVHREKELLMEANRLITENMDYRDDSKDHVIASLRKENHMLKEMVGELRETNNDLRERIRTAPAPQDKPHSYAAAAFTGTTTTAKSTRPIQRPALKSTTVRHAIKTAAETAQVIKEKLSAHQHNLKASVTVIGQGVRIQCANDAQLATIKSKIDEEGLVTTDRRLLKPQVRIEGVEDFDFESFVSTVNDLNDKIFGENSKVATTMTNRRNKKATDVIIETDGPTQRALLAKGSLLHGYSRCRTFENVQVRQCVRCLGLGHKKDHCDHCERCLEKGHDAKNCKKLARSRCFRCGGDHRRQDCPAATEPKCSVCFHHPRVINAKNTKDHCDHTMLGRDCPQREQAEIAMRNRTDYG